MQIETKRLFLRPYEQRDLDDVFAYASQTDVFEPDGKVACQTHDEAAKLLASWIENKNRFAIVLKERGRVIGGIVIKPDSEEGRPDTRELGYMLNHDYHRRGLMSEAVLAILDFIFESDTEFVWGCCFQQNISSAALLKKLGFTLQKCGTYYSDAAKKQLDTFEYRITRSEYYAVKNDFTK